MQVRIDRQSRGNVELLLLLPIIVLLAYGIGALYQKHFVRLRLARTKWVHSVSRAHHVGEGKAWGQTGEIWKKALPNHAPTHSREASRKREAVLALSAKGLPYAFQWFVFSNGSEAVHYRRDGFDAWAMIPGSDFGGDRGLRQALWQEAMHHAGFGLLPLQLLAIPELSEAAAALGGGLGGAGGDLVSEYAKRKGKEWLGDLAPAAIPLRFDELKTILQKKGVEFGTSKITTEMDRYRKTWGVN